MRNLTVRGRCFLAAGAAAVICGIWIGERDFVRIGLLALLVPVVAWLVLRLSERKVWVRRDLSDLHVEAGGAAHVQLQVGTAGRRTGLLLLEEELPATLGGPQRFLVEPLGPGEETTLHYVVRSEQRGRYPLGPVHVRVADPIGMVDLAQVLPSTASLLVTPRTEPLPRMPLAGSWAGSGENRSRELTGGGSPDVTTREYRIGDDLRRIHWPTSARTDQLMVRREEHQWQPRCTVLIDNRRLAHRGRGAGSSLETAVSAAASLLRHLVGLDFDVRLVSASDESAYLGWHQGARGATLPHQLERLALLGPTSRERLPSAWVEASHQDGMLLAVVGHLDEPDRRLLSGLTSAGSPAYAVVLDVATWDGGGRTEPPATAALRRGGWQATTLPRDGALAASWLELAR